MSEQPWIRSFALLPRRLTHGGWVWLAPFEWQWRVPPGDAPRAVRRPVVVSRRVQGREPTGERALSAS
jgi:hypothetical protein